MDDLRYILQEPVELQGIGILYPMNILEFNKNIKSFNILGITKNNLLQGIDVKDLEKRDYIEKNIKNFDVITSQKELIALLLNLLIVCFKLNEKNDIEIKQSEDNNGIYFLLKGNRIDRNNYDFVRNQIIRMHNLHFPKQAKNAELQKWFDKARKAKNKGNNDKTDMEDIITTIVATTGIPFKEIKEMSVYQINRLIARINKVKEFDTNVQFLCAGGQNIKLDSYLTHIEEEIEEKLSVGLDEFKRGMASNSMGA